MFIFDFYFLLILKNNDNLILPKSVSLNKLQQIKSQLNNFFDKSVQIPKKLEACSTTIQPTTNINVNYKAMSTKVIVYLALNFKFQSKKPNFLRIKVSIEKLKPLLTMF
jgi:hypothetical protein